MIIVYGSLVQPDVVRIDVRLLLCSALLSTHDYDHHQDWTPHLPACRRITMLPFLGRHSALYSSPPRGRSDAPYIKDQVMSSTIINLISNKYATY